MRRASLIACLVAAGGASPVQAIELSQTVWGFDGQVVAHRFNLFSVLVDNSTSNPFEGQIELRKVMLGKQVDAVLVEPVYLAPFSSRWVQFYPYLKADPGKWEISLGDGRGGPCDFRERAGREGGRRAPR